MGLSDRVARIEHVLRGRDLVMIRLQVARAEGKLLAAGLLFPPRRRRAERPVLPVTSRRATVRLPDGRFGFDHEPAG